MKHSQYHSLLLIVVVFEALRHSSGEATFGLTSGAEEDDSVLNSQAQRDVTHNAVLLPKPASHISLLNDHTSVAVEMGLVDASSAMDDAHTSLHQRAPKTIKVIKAAAKRKRKLKKDGGGNQDKRDGGKKSKKGQSTNDDDETESGFIAASTVGRQSNPTPIPIPRLNPLPPPINDNVFDRRRSPAYINRRPSFSPPDLRPSPYTGTARPTPSSFSGNRPMFPTRRVPTRAPNPTPVPTSEMTESLFPTDSSTFGVTLEYTTLPPSLSPAPTE